LHEVIRLDHTRQPTFHAMSHAPDPRRKFPDAFFEINSGKQ
jgi:hypothetical protein